MLNNDDLSNLQEQLESLGRKKAELATMCRIAELHDVRAQLKILQEKFHSAVANRESEIPAVTGEA